MAALTDEQLRRLSVDERLDLLEAIWTSLEDAALPLTDAQRAELDRRLDDPAPEPLIPWAEVRAELRGE